MKGFGNAILIGIIIAFGSPLVLGHLFTKQKQMKEEIQALQTEIAEKDNRLSEMEINMAEKDVLNNQLQQDIAQSQNDVSEIQAELDQTRILLDQALIDIEEYEEKTSELTSLLNAAQEELSERDASYKEHLAQIEIMEIQLEHERQEASEIQTEMDDLTQTDNSYFTSLFFNNNSILMIFAAGIGCFSVVFSTYQYIRENPDFWKSQTGKSTRKGADNYWDDPKYREFRREKARAMERRSRSKRK